MYEIVSTADFERKLKKLIKKNESLRFFYAKAVNKLAHDPFSSSLRTHPVDTFRYDRRKSSYVTGDLGIIWDFDKNRQKVILLLTTGGHEGANKVYK